MFNDVERLVVGAGTSALTFLYTAMLGAHFQRFTGGKTVVVGEEDLWNATKAGGQAHHAMGQPREFLYPIHQTGKVGAMAIGSKGLMTTSTYTDELGKLRDEIQTRARMPIHQRRGLEYMFLKDRVYSIKRQGKRYEVLTVKRRRYRAEQVIIASGPGPGLVPPHAKMPDPSRGGGNRSAILNHVELAVPKFARDFDEILDGVDFLTHPQDCTGQTVVVNGGSATAAWAAARAHETGAARILWVARSGFKDSNPAGRNTEIITYCSQQGWMQLGEVTRIEALRTSTKAEPRLKLTLVPPNAPVAQNRVPVTGSQAVLPPVNITEITAHRYVYSFGLDPTAPGGPAQILDPPLVAELAFRFDESSRFHDKEPTIVALATPDDSLWVVGAAVFRGMGITTRLSNDRPFNTVVQERWKHISNIFSEPGTPFEGIAVAKASIKSVTGFYEVPLREGGMINWQTADRMEFRFWVARQLGCSQYQALLVADSIIARRRVAKQGWNYLEFAKVLSEAAQQHEVVKYRQI